MTPDQARLEAARAAPRIVLLWQALTALRSTVSFMQSGAHPDDEISSMLAALRFRDGLDISYVCSTRGEGGQNDIGREAGAALGTLRTAEMEAASARLDLDMYWLSQWPGDIADFGFSKHGDETLGRWGHARTLERFVQVVRQAKPDILCPTFLDVPGQHGHHRAMTALAHEVMGRAADSTYLPESAPWQVSKLYLPAWSGAGQAYDDDLPPPPGTVCVDGKDRDPVTGWSWGQIGQFSRAMHRTQGMGRWPDAARDWPLHLVDGQAEGSVMDGLPTCLSDIGYPAAQAACDAAIEAFPNGPAVLQHAAEALRILRAEPPAPGHAHRIDTKIAQLSRVLWLASGAEARATVDADWIAPGAAASATVEVDPADLTDLSANLALPEGWKVSGNQLTVTETAEIEPYPDQWLPLHPPLPALDVAATIGGQAVSLRLPLDRTPAALPAGPVTLSPEADVVNLSAERREVAVRLTPPEAYLEGWQQVEGNLTIPADATPGHHDIPVTLNGAPARTERRILTPHTAPRVLARPAILRLALLDVALPQARVGYIGADRDRVAHWMRRIGLSVTELDDSMLGDDSALSAFDSIVIGIFALRFRPGLAARMPAINAWVRGGGTLTTLYHRPWDNWDPETVPPARLQIGQPSLRWRVTDNTADVTHLAPDHPILTGPNPIWPEDWDGWNKERGLYFASSWDDAYTPLLSMSDPGEAPLHGALLSAQIGQGRHTHCALILHHQMEHLVPGAFRLMANLVAPT